MSEVRVGSSEVRVSATDELRRMLDERGVEYNDRDMFGKHVFHWGEPLHGAMFTDGGEWTELVVENATPAQAIAATLGRGTCRNVGYYIDGTRFKCSACGYNGWTKYAADGNDRVPNYCPNCGRRVVDE